MDSVVLKSGIGRMLSKKKKKRKMVQVRCNQTDFVQQSALCCVLFVFSSRLCCCSCPCSYDSLCAPVDCNGNNRALGRPMKRKL